jgi:RNA polymerase sigma-70 factor (ECF subfamily)
MIYVVVPRDLAPKLHVLLRRHFRDEVDVEVVVERRTAERRRDERRAPDGLRAPSSERRRIRNLQGRRVADRRLALAGVVAPPLPRKAQPYADRLLFLERVAPTAEKQEDIDTARLVTRIQAGDREGYADLYLRYFDRVYGYLQVILRDRHDAEEVTQQVFVKVLEGLPSYQRRKQPFRAWLFVIVRNTALTELHKRQRLQLLEPEELDRQREAANGEEAGDLSALGWITDRELMMFFERLPLAQRQVLVLRFMLDLPPNQIAEILGRSNEDVRSLQHRGLRFLEQRLSVLGRAPRQDRQSHWRRRTTWLGVVRERRFALR